MKKDAALIDLIAKAGSMSELARQLNVTRSAVFYWQKVPVKHLLALEKLYNVPRQQLRPDLYGDASEAQEEPDGSDPALLGHGPKHRRNS